MSKIRYFNNKLSKIAKCWRLCAPSAQLTSDLATWICPNFIFSNGLWQNQTFKNQLWRHFSDIIVITTPKTSPN